jgi:hypothetical protein
MDFRDQRAGGVNNPSFPQMAFLAHFRGNPVGAVDNSFPFRDFIHAVHENRALGLQILYYETVVDDFLADVNGRPKSLKRDADNINGPNHPGAKAAGLEQEQSFTFVLWRSILHYQSSNSLL